MATFHEREDMLYEIQDSLWDLKKALVRDLFELRQPDANLGPHGEAALERLQREFPLVNTSLTEFTGLL